MGAICDACVWCYATYRGVVMPSVACESKAVPVVMCGFRLLLPQASRHLSDNDAAKFRELL
eukprot:42479-Alexandrium_andersonii.AAC.1